MATVDCVEEVPAKKAKLSDSNNGLSHVHSIEALKDFTVKRVLQENSQRKIVFVEGRFKDDEDKPAVVVLEKTPFSSEPTELDGLFGAAVDLEQHFTNDVYTNCTLQVDPTSNGIKATLVYPATEQHIKKYLRTPSYIVEETPELYKQVTLPYIEAEQLKLNWVYNILKHEQEADRIAYEDPDPEVGFVLIPDLKWDGKQKENLYLVAIVHKSGIKSLRDLDAGHLPLLRNIREKALGAIAEKYGIPASRVRVFLHYQPSYYHLHVHFQVLDYEGPGILAEKAHLLTSVISNIEIVGDYYKKAVLSFVSHESTGLFEEYKSAKYPFGLQE